MKNQILRYFKTWWLPPALAFGCLGLLALGMYKEIQAQNLRWLMSLLFLLTAASLAGMAAATIGHFYLKQWKKGLAGLLALLLYLVGSPFLLFYVSMSGPDTDGFADKLTIPAGLAISEPLGELRPGGTADAMQAAVLNALKKPGSGDETFAADVPSLLELETRSPELLRLYLAENPAWRVFREKGELFATRRWKLGGGWRYTLHGYYTDNDLGLPANSPKFQARLTLGLSGKPWAGGIFKGKRWNAGDTVRPELKAENGRFESAPVIIFRDIVLEIYEQSDNKERRLTKAALAQLESELRPLLKARDAAAVKKLLPPGGIKTGAPDFSLRSSFQPGIYDAEIRVNPGEPGMVYLKAFEVTRGTPLSAGDLKEYSGEYTGWSQDKKEQFLSNTTFSIYEGDWGKPYAARFEVWFAPDSGRPERRLLEKNFKIEGWQR